jgi:CheY-like chemotaxis protein
VLACPPFFELIKNKTTITPMLNSQPPKILIVDNNKHLSTLPTSIQQHLQAQIFQTDSSKAALKYLEQETIDLVIIELQTLDLDSLQIAKITQTGKNTQPPPITLLTAATENNHTQLINKITSSLKLANTTSSFGKICNNSLKKKLMSRYKPIRI